MKKQHPIIGITTYGINDKNHFYLPANYVQVVRKAGGIPVLLPPGDKHIEQTLISLDGLIFSGGGDIDPKCYKKKMHRTIYNLDSVRDSSEFKLAKAVLKTSLPTLAICRGMQVMNIVMGGNLHLHIPDVFGQKVKHRAPQRKPITHQVELTKNCELKKIFQARKFPVASWHHQAIDKLSKDLVAVGFSADGVIEAAEMPTHPWLYCVQWHPEISADRDPIQQRLFRALVTCLKQ